MYRKRTPLSALDDWDDIDRGEEEEETVHIDDGPSQTSNSALLSSMPVQKPPRPSAPSKAATKEDEVPNVFLDTHYHKLYNQYVRYRCLSDDEDSSSSSSSSSEEEEEEDLFASLFGEQNKKTKRTREESSSQSEKKHQHKKRKLEMTKTLPATEYDSLRRPECFLCAWGNKFHDGIKAKHVNNLMDIMDEYGKCSNVELAGMLHLYFKNKVYKPEEGMSMLTKEVALEHIEGLHSLSASIFVGESIRKWKKIFFGFENALFKENGKYDEKAFDKLEKAQKILIMLYKLKIQELNFSLGKSSEDTRRIAHPFNLMQEFKQTASNRQRIKKKHKLTQLSPLLPSQGFET